MRKLKKRKEDMADEWLRKHDPYYGSSEVHKKKYLQRPYYTPDQEVRRLRKEIPLSCLGDKDIDYFDIRVDL